MKSDDLLAIVDFLYCGEANVFQENLDSFLAITEELQLKGLMGKTDGKLQDFEADEKPVAPTILPVVNSGAKITNNSFKRLIPSSTIHNPVENRTLAIPSNFSGNLDEIEARVKSMMEKSQTKLGNKRGFADLCKVCGKEGIYHHIKDHIEANHLEGIVIPCNLCDKTFRSRNGFRLHMRQKHNKLT